MKIRDFIYLDNDLLYSLYSQVFEGVVEAVTDSYAAEKTTTDKQRKLDAKVAEASIRVENKILYDHMYNKLEEKLQKCISDLSDADNIALEDLRNKFVVKIKGRATIHDYSRLRDYMENFNKLGEAIAYAILSSDATADISKNGIIKYAKGHGLYLSDRTTDNIKINIDCFNNQSYEVNICSRKGSSLLYKGIINKDWLRMSPTIIRELYSDTPMMDWIMVGKVTAVPQSADTTVTTTPTEAVNPPQTKTISDSYIDMFQSYHNLEVTAHESKLYKKIHIVPIAIYTETEIDDID